MPLNPAFSWSTVIPNTQVLEDVHILQDAKDGLASLLKGEFNSIISKSPMDVGRCVCSSYEGKHLLKM